MGRVRTDCQRRGPMARVEHSMGAHTVPVPRSGRLSRGCNMQQCLRAKVALLRAAEEAQFMDERRLRRTINVYDRFILLPNYQMAADALPLEVWHAYYRLMASGNVPWIP